MYQEARINKTQSLLSRGSYGAEVYKHSCNMIIAIWLYGQSTFKTQKTVPVPGYREWDRCHSMQWYFSRFVKGKSCFLRRTKEWKVMEQWC